MPELGEELTILGFPGASGLASITLTTGKVSGFEMAEMIDENIDSTLRTYFLEG